MSFNIEYKGKNPIETTDNLTIKKYVHERQWWIAKLWKYQLNKLFSFPGDISTYIHHKRWQNNWFDPLLLVIHHNGLASTNKQTWDVAFINKWTEITLPVLLLPSLTLQLYPVSQSLKYIYILQATAPAFSTTKTHVYISIYKIHHRTHFFAKYELNTYQ